MGRSRVRLRRAVGAFIGASALLFTAYLGANENGQATDREQDKGGKLSVFGGVVDSGMKTHTTATDSHRMFTAPTPGIVFVVAQAHLISKGIWPMQSLTHGRETRIYQSSSKA